jgi:hypothetical protein
MELRCRCGENTVKERCAPAHHGRLPEVVRNMLPQGMPRSSSLARVATETATGGRVRLPLGSNVAGNAASHVDAALTCVAPTVRQIDERHPAQRHLADARRVRGRNLRANRCAAGPGEPHGYNAVASQPDYRDDATCSSRPITRRGWARASRWTNARSGGNSCAGQRSECEIR